MAETFKTERDIKENLSPKEKGLQETSTVAPKQEKAVQEPRKELGIGKKLQTVSAAMTLLSFVPSERQEKIINGLLTGRASHRDRTNTLSNFVSSS